MMTDRNLIRSLGSEPPILADGRRAPDRREISLRWLSGTFLTGITSSILMGVALFAALDGRQQLAIPAEAYASLEPHGRGVPPASTVTRGERIVEPSIVAKAEDKKIMEVSTMIHDGEKEVVRRQPFALVKMALAANHVVNEDYPRFDPLSIFSSSAPDEQPVSRTGTIYGSEVESEVALKTGEFPTGGSALDYADQMSLDEVEENVRTNGSVLTDGSTQLASLYYVDPRRFASDASDLDLLQGLTARIVEENMTVSTFDSLTPDDPEYAEDVIPVRRTQDIVTLMTANGYTKAQAEDLSAYLSKVIGGTEVAEGDVLRICIIQKGKEANIVRASVYERGRHLATVALDDDGAFVAGSEPPALDAVATAFDDDHGPSMMSGRDLPRVYDGIYRAALSYGMGARLTGEMVRVLASNVDFQAQLRPNDSLEAFFSVADTAGLATEDSELLFINAKFGDTETRVYRFQNGEDGSVDYYDENGKSIRQFLLRNPVPNGRLSSGFGMRRHPILAFSRMHTGTDWAAPRGTPIIATGNGVVLEAGWSSSYGNQTLIRHANGYVSSYNHQSAIAKGVREGAKVTQGQVIGYVGSTGLSTGAHLHYELIVNGTKVDAMKVRLPGGKSLEGKALAQFEIERHRIDDLLGRDENAPEVARKD
ncbi:M23 family metallopeptidase [Sinorhizobium sp. BG8]|uniref:M23 family metallopeptidase n=1 Tax=Sinorhizobium sp. BG8 TaxID=2613773 RepID=UPI00193C8721|nr:M23 family metallopeptidase [Sinorhizobium sp. BG8]QRM53311.1 M23 family metallopeptidase [Sinorhizobium sp. BG8]